MRLAAGLALLLALPLRAAPPPGDGDDDEDPYVEHLDRVEESSPKELTAYGTELSRRLASERDPEKRAEVREMLEDVRDELSDLEPGPSAGSRRSGGPLYPRAGDAAATAEAALARNPASGPANRLAARTALDRGDYKTAAARASAALKADPKDARALGYRGFARSMLGDRAGASKDLRRALELKPGDRRLQTLSGLAEGRGLPSRPPPAGAGFDQGGSGASPGTPSAPRPGRPAPGAPAREPAPRTEGYDAKTESMTKRARRRLAVGDPELALQLAGRVAAAGGPDAPEARLVAGKALLAKGEAAKAEEEETAALDAGLDAALDALLEKALAEADAQERGEAEKDARAAAAISPRRLGEEPYRAVRALLGSGGEAGLGEERPPSRPSDAPPPARGPAAGGMRIPEYSRGISAKSLALAREAQARLALGDAPEAERLAALALKEDPRNHYAYIVLAAALRARGRHREALAAAGRALRLSPLSVEALLARGEARLRLARPGPALEDAEAAIRIHPDDPQAYLLRARARGALGDERGRAEDEARAAGLASGSGSPPPRRGRGGLAAAAALGLGLAGFGLWRSLRAGRAPS